ncbi:MAG TPA: AAA family ATPase [Sutterellaceae bacterium]|nr:AAA family ATPase [Sutterellaceae bacterium]
MVYRLAQHRGKIFLARPMRFGKSLLVSTFESLFKNGLKAFIGLAIEKLWTDKTYPVIRLDFSELKEFGSEDFLEILRLKFSSHTSIILSPWSST